MEKFEQDTFNKIKRIMSCNTLLTYPDFNKTFKIHTNTRAFQLGEVISQKRKPISFYSRKITDTPQRYIVIYRELLSISETLKDFRTIFIGRNLIIYTNNKKLTCVICA